MINDSDLLKYITAIEMINNAQERIIGKSIASMISHNVVGLNYSGNKPVIANDIDPKEILKNLVDGYATIFGKASLKVSKDAVKTLKPALSANELPENLR